MPRKRRTKEEREEEKKARSIKECSYLGCRLAYVGMKEGNASLDPAAVSPVLLHEYQCIHCDRLFYFDHEADVIKPYFAGDQRLA